MLYAPSTVLIAGFFPFTSFYPNYEYAIAGVHPFLAKYEYTCAEFCFKIPILTPHPRSGTLQMQTLLPPLMGAQGYQRFLFLNLE